MPNFDSKIIQAVHDDYQRHEADWMFFAQSYQGGREWVTPDNLWTHAREPQEKYIKRMRRATFLNYCEPVIDIWTSHIFGSDTRPMRRIDNDGFEEFSSNVDLRGTDIDGFMRNLSIDCQIYGMVGVAVDVPASDIDIQTEADRQQNGIRPYFCAFTPPAITNWSMDRFGQLNWIRVRETLADDADPSVMPGKSQVVYRTWDREFWYVNSEDGTEIGFGEHGLGLVPFILIYFRRNRTSGFLGKSQLTDIAQINRALVNTLSYIDEFISNQAFSFLASGEDDMASGSSNITIATDRIFTYPVEGSPPSYITPSTEPPAFMRELIQDFYRREIFRLAKLEQREMAEQSGVAKMMDFHQTDNALSHYAHNLRDGEKALLDIWSRYQGGADLDGTIIYPTSFDLQPINDAIKNALDLRDLFGDKSARFVSEHLRRLVDRIEPHLPEEAVEAIGRELDQVAVSDARFTAATLEMEDA